LKEYKEELKEAVATGNQGAREELERLRVHRRPPLEERTYRHETWNRRRARQQEQDWQQQQRQTVNQTPTAAPAQSQMPLPPPPANPASESASASPFPARDSPEGQQFIQTFHAAYPGIVMPMDDTNEIDYVEVWRIHDEAKERDQDQNQDQS
jgi:hypothetical protein